MYFFTVLCSLCFYSFKKFLIYPQCCRIVCLNAMSFVKLKADIFNKYYKWRIGLSNLYKREIHDKGTEDNAQITFQIIKNLHDPRAYMSQPIWQTVNIVTLWDGNSEHCENSVRGRHPWQSWHIPPKNIHCGKHKANRQGNMSLVPMKQTYVNIQPATEVAWTVPYWTAIRAVFLCTAGHFLMVDWVNELALASVVWSLWKRFSLKRAT